MAGSDLSREREREQSGDLKKVLDDGNDDDFRNDQLGHIIINMIMLRSVTVIHDKCFIYVIEVELCIFFFF